ncbi:hypothetical protein L210DRAFT_113263, partial [Boletus edulis BED1]
MSYLARFHVSRHCYSLLFDGTKNMSMVSVHHFPCPIGHQVTMTWWKGFLFGTVSRKHAYQRVSARDRHPFNTACFIVGLIVEIPTGRIQNKGD